MTESQENNNNTQSDNQVNSDHPRYFRIDKNIPVSKVGYVRRSKWVVKVLEMVPGDSRLVPNRYARDTLCRAIKNQGFKTVSRKNCHGYRVWKMEALKGE